MSTAPTLTTERLRLRPYRIEDFEPLAALMASDWSVHMGGPFGRQESWAYFASEAANWALRGHGGWSVETEDGTLAGQVSLNRMAHWPEVELGWTVWPAFEGKGIAFEAATAARNWAFGSGGLETLVSYIAPGNARSIALAERLGATHDAAAPLPDGETPDETHVYRHPRPEHA
ncbi:GNAT family N-acetyltransferase [Vannielia litorea]|uniref:GNAT family N-acetyltransferase n=1 Tax=Vannielia litorea TaxID=1217970 RepID=UPI001BCE6FAF|nr:GNAT family N-acetyltransferase [Vannielia litorea]MBS8226577.1 N-acetyltransferase [Vannielia litorea]